MPLRYGKRPRSESAPGPLERQDEIDEHVVTAEEDEGDGTADGLSAGDY